MRGSTQSLVRSDLMVLFKIIGRVHHSAESCRWVALHMLKIIKLWEHESALALWVPWVFLLRISELFKVAFCRVLIRIFIYNQILESSVIKRCLAWQKVILPLYLYIEVIQKVDVVEINYRPTYSLVFYLGKRMFLWFLLWVVRSR